MNKRTSTPKCGSGAGLEWLRPAWDIALGLELKVGSSHSGRARQRERVESESKLWLQDDAAPHENHEAASPERGPSPEPSQRA